MDNQETPQAEWDAVVAERAVETPAANVEVAPEIPPPAETTATEANAGDAPPTKEAVVDPYAGLSAPDRFKLEQFDKLMESFPQLVTELKETKGRVSAMQSEFAKSRQAQPAGDAPNQKQIKAAAKDSEEWTSLKRDFPEWAAGLEAFVESRVGAISGSGLTADQVEAQIAQRVDANTQALTGEFQKDLISMRHASWTDTVKTAEFVQWFQSQRADVQELARSPKGLDAIRMLDMYVESQKTPVATVQQTRKEKLAAAVTTTSKAPAASTKTFEDLNSREQWDYLAAERASKG